MEIYLCGKDELDSYSNVGITHLLSLEDPEIPEERPSWIDPERYLRITFHDANFNDPLQPQIQGPTREHILEALQFGAMAEVYPNSHLLIQGATGSGRSWSIALLLLTQEIGGYPAIEKLKTMKPCSIPNTLVIRLGEEIMNWDNSLSSHLEKQNGLR